MTARSRISSAATLGPLRAAADRVNPVMGKFLRDRGPHLAAMVAYYALLSLVPFLFLTLSLLAFIGHVGSSSYVIRELHHILPGQSVGDLITTVHTIQRSAGTLGVIGLLGIVWASLGFYSALESAMNIVYDVQNRAFLHQKWITFVLVLLSLVTLFVSLLAATTSTAFFDRHAPHLVDLRISGFLLTLAATTLGGFAFLMIVYRYLTNVPLHRGDVMPGAVVGAVLFQVSLQALPLYLRFSGQLLALRAFGGLVILLVWLYLMANIIVLGAEINSVRWHQRREAEVEPPGLA
jgi:membrane protein